MPGFELTTFSSSSVSSYYHKSGLFIAIIFLFFLENRYDTKAFLSGYFLSRGGFHLTCNKFEASNVTINLLADYEFVRVKLTVIG